MARKAAAAAEPLEVGPSGLVVAREAVVINVGAKPAVWHTAEVLNKRTDQIETVNLTEVEPKEPEEEGIPYAFKAYQKVRADHPAVLECPQAFMAYDDLSPADRELVTAA